MNYDELIKSRHPLYDESYFNLLEDMVLGGKDALSPVYIKSHTREDSDIYKTRVERASFPNYLKTICSFSADYIFQSGVERVGFAPYSDDVDFQANNLNTFMKNYVARYSQIHGVTYVLVDAPNAEEISSGVENRPYWVHIKRQNLLNWSLDRFGKPYWILIRDSIGDPAEPLTKREDKVSYYKLITRDEFIFLRQKDRKTEVVSRISNTLGYIPIEAIAVDRKSRFDGDSWFADTVFLNKELLNHHSELENLIRESAIETLVVQGNSDDVKDMIKSSSYVLTYRGDIAPTFVAPSGRAAELLEYRIAQLKNDLYRISRQRIINGSASADGASGESKKEDFLTTSTSLSSLAQELERGENRLHEISSDFLQSGAPIKAVYPRDYTIDKVDQALERLIKMNDAQVPEPLKRYQTIDLARKIVGPNPTAKDRKLINDVNIDIVAKQNTSTNSINSLDNNSTEQVEKNSE